MDASDRDGQFAPGRLWSLLDLMEKFPLHEFWGMAARWHDAYASVFFAEGEELNKEVRDRLSLALVDLRSFCNRWGLDTSTLLVAEKLKSLPTSSGEMNLLWIAVRSELQSRTVLFISAERARYLEKDDLVSEETRAYFPLASQELRIAGNCFAASLDTACVFHCMRALEHGLRAVANDVSVTFDIQYWQTVLDEIASKVAALGKTLPRGKNKNERLQFLSEAVSEFRYFKDGWRNYVSHKHVSYGEQQALKVLGHTSSFIDALSLKLTE